ncbi:hypothetical protein MtrunA17_Chr5g0421371 [Medicago truncatula]|uniref:Transmembrane protein n=1 Tax=Medicago truncatula TaxID=3880 RepID=A0A396HT88_MEDTR|nr:hypothetical protein MtrunA17_Chr5g0421371 [Medicago truncatula]
MSNNTNFSTFDLVCLCHLLNILILSYCFPYHQTRKRELLISLSFFAKYT